MPRRISRRTANMHLCTWILLRSTGRRREEETGRFQSSARPSISPGFGGPGPWYIRHPCLEYRLNFSDCLESIYADRASHPSTARQDVASPSLFIHPSSQASWPPKPLPPLRSPPFERTACGWRYLWPLNQVSPSRSLTATGLTSTGTCSRR